MEVNHILIETNLIAPPSSWPIRIISPDVLPQRSRVNEKEFLPDKITDSSTCDLCGIISDRKNVPRNNTCSHVLCFNCHVVHLEQEIQVVKDVSRIHCVFHTISSCAYGLYSVSMVAEILNHFTNSTRIKMLRHNYTSKLKVIMINLPQRGFKVCMKCGSIHEIEKDCKCFICNIHSNKTLDPSPMALFFRSRECPVCKSLNKYEDEEMLKCKYCLYQFCRNCGLPNHATNNTWMEVEKQTFYTREPIRIKSQPKQVQVTGCKLDPSLVFTIDREFYNMHKDSISCAFLCLKGDENAYNNIRDNLEPSLGVFLSLEEIIVPKYSEIVTCRLAISIGEIKFFTNSFFIVNPIDLIGKNDK